MYTKASGGGKLHGFPCPWNSFHVNPLYGCLFRPGSHLGQTIRFSQRNPCSPHLKDRNHDRKNPWRCNHSHDTGFDRAVPDLSAWVQDSQSRKSWAGVTLHGPDSHLLYRPWPCHSLKNERYARLPVDNELPDHAYLLPIRSPLPPRKPSSNNLFHKQDRPPYLWRRWPEGSHYRNKYFRHLQRSGSNRYIIGPCLCDRSSTVFKARGIIPDFRSKSGLNPLVT